MKNGERKANNDKLKIKIVTFAFFTVVFTFSFFVFPFSDAEAATIGRPQNNLGLVGYWDFDVGKGGNTAYDRSGLGNDGTIENATGSVNWVNGKIGQGFEFDGVDDLINLGDSDDINTGGPYSKKTTGLWFYANDVSSRQVLYEQGGSTAGMNIYLDSGVLYTRAYNTVEWSKELEASSTPIESGRWYHVTSVLDATGDSLTLFIDGNVAASDTKTGGQTLISQGNDCGIGRNNGGTLFHDGTSSGSASFDGTIDDVRHYNERTLSAGEVARLYKLGTSGGQKVNVTKTVVEGGLIGHWTMDGNDVDTASSAPVVRDRSGGSNDAYPYTEDNLVGYWTFDDHDVISSTSTDRSGQGNDGTISGGVTTGFSGEIGEAYDFDGVDGSDVQTGLSIKSENALSFAFWFNADDITGGNANTILWEGDGTGNGGGGEQEFEIGAGCATWLIGGGCDADEDGLYVHFESDETGGTQTEDISIVVDDFSDTTNWHHMVVTVADFNGSEPTANVYVDNVLEATDTASSVPTTTWDTNLRIGTTGAGTRNYDGALDDVRIYNRVLGTDEIADLFAKKAGTGQRFVSGKLGQALEFDGVDDYVDTNYAPSLSASDSFAVSLWFQSDQTSFASDEAFFGSGAILSGGGQLEIEIDGDGTLCADDAISIRFRDDGTGNNDVCSSFVANNTDWHHLIYTYDDTSDQKLYIDGILENTVGISNINGAKDFTGTPFAIGAYNQDGTVIEFFDGSLDDVRIYDRALTVDEIQRIYNAGAGDKVNSSFTNRLAGGLVGHWTFDGSTMTDGNATTSDVSGNSNNGALQNGPTPNAGKLGQALEFDGGDDTIIVSNESNFDFERTDSFSLSTWVNPRVTLSDGAEMALVSKLLSADPFTGFALQLTALSGETNNNIRTLLINDWGAGNRLYTTSNYSVPTSTWTHVVLTYDGSSAVSGVTNYVNGQAVSLNGSAQEDNLSSSILNDLSLMLGSRDDASLYLDGELDDVRIYNRVLTAREIQQLYNLGQ